MQYDMRMPGGAKEKYPNVGTGARARKDPGNQVEFKNLEIPIISEDYRLPNSKVL